MAMAKIKKAWKKYPFLFNLIPFLFNLIYRYSFIYYMCIMSIDLCAKI
jgi:hypothetical protein